MNPQQIENAKNHCSQIDNMDIIDILLKRNIENVGKYDLNEFVTLTRRVTKQLTSELQSENASFLPFQYQFHNEYGNGNLDNDLSNFINRIHNVEYAQLETIIGRLIYYQIANGFWDRGVRNIYDTREISIVKKQQSLIVLEELLKKEVESLKKDRENLANFISQKNGELQQIERSLSSSNINATEIASLLNTSISNNEKINSVLNNQQIKFKEYNQILDNLKEDIDITSTRFVATVNQAETNIQEFEAKQTLFKSHLDIIESKKSYFEERNNYLDNLIGREVGASLFETFKQRKIELENPVEFWKWAVPIMSIVTVGWIFFLFYNFTISGNFNENCLLFALNTLKTIPAVILTYFTINQYRKERNFQEEYAFKSAVALTISEYANRLTSSENKDKLIMDAVTGIFISPIERKLKEAELKNNSFNETVKSLKDTLSELADKIKK